MTVMFYIDPEFIDLEIVKFCAEVILKGGLVVFPTETVYGIGANVFDRNAILKVFQVKNRPSVDPLTIHIAKIDQMYEFVDEVPENVIQIIKKLWPGPLTIILKKSGNVISEVTSGRETVGIRLPAHNVAIKLIEYSIPIVGPSANISGRPSPTKIEHVIEDLDEKIDIIIDSGSTFYGIDSTVIDFTTKPPKLLRPGPIPIEEIEKVIGEKIEISKEILEKNSRPHYKIGKPLILIECSDFNKKVKLFIEKLNEFIKKNLKICLIISFELLNELKKYFDIMNFKIEVLGSRSNLIQVCKVLYDKLRRVEKLNCDIVLTEDFGYQGLGLSITYRLKQACSESITC